MLCSLSISQWSASKHDREASEEIAIHHGAQPDVGRYNKLLIPKETLAEVRRIAGEARREHYFMTLPWDDNGYRVLAAVYMEHTEKLREYSRQFMAAVEVFAAQFDQLVELRRKYLNRRHELPRILPQLFRVLHVNGCQHSVSVVIPRQSHEVVLPPGFAGDPAHLCQGLLGNEQFVVAAYVGLRAVVDSDFLRGLAIVLRCRPLRNRERAQHGSRRQGCFRTRDGRHVFSAPLELRYCNRFASSF